MENELYNVHSKVQTKYTFYFLSINEYQLKQTEISIYSNLHILVCLYPALFWLKFNIYLLAIWRGLNTTLKCPKKFRFDQVSGRRRTALWMCYFQIIHSFIHSFFLSFLLLYCVRGTRTQPLICVGYSVHYWVSCAINKGGFSEIAFSSSWSTHICLALRRLLKFSLTLMR